MRPLLVLLAALALEVGAPVAAYWLAPPGRGADAVSATFAAVIAIILGGTLTWFLRQSRREQRNGPGAPHAPGPSPADQL